MNLLLAVALIVAGVCVAVFLSGRAQVWELQQLSQQQHEHAARDAAGRAKWRPGGEGKSKHARTAVKATTKQQRAMTARPSVCTVVIIGDSSISIRLRIGEMVAIDRAKACRSQLLRDLIRSSTSQRSQSPRTVEVPLREEAMLKWVQQESSTATTADGAERGPQDDVCTLCMLIQAADVLVDEEMQAAATATLGKLLLHSGYWRSSSRRLEATQALERLPEHLLYAVLSQLPLASCLQQLPPILHSAALSAHHPSIDAHGSLHLQRLPLEVMETALRAIKKLPHIRALSFAGTTLPSTPDTLPLVEMALTALTALDMADSCASTAAITYISAPPDIFPALPQLRSLDVSDNRIRTRALASLGKALLKCTALRTLRMLRTVSYAEPAYGGCELIAHCLPALPALTELAFGAYGDLRQPREAMEFSTSLHALLTAARGSAALRVLEMDFPGTEVLPISITAVVDAMSAITQLHRLRLPGAQQCTVGGLAAKAPGSIWPRALGALTRLTALRLDELRWVAGRGACGQAVAELTRMRSLRGLTLCIDNNDALPLFARVLQRLTQLTRLDVSLHTASHGLPRFSIEPEGLVAIAAAATSTLCALRVLHLPVAAASGYTDRIVAMLSGATHLQLSIDVHASCVTDESADTSGQGFLQQYVPLFPCVRGMFLETRTAWEWMMPVATKATSLSRLESLCINGDKHALLLGSTPIRILRSLRHMSALQRLGGKLLGQDGSARAAAAALYDSAAQLTALTALELRVDGMDHTLEDSMPATLDAVMSTCEAMPELQRLHLQFAEQEELKAGIDWLGSLRVPLSVKTLIVNAGHENMTVLFGDMVDHLPHLRLLKVQTTGLAHRPARAAKQALIDLETRLVRPWPDRFLAVEFEPAINALFGHVRCEDEQVLASRRAAQES
eukprot:jgi/Ulvmu1/12412/UM009_0062.1